MNSFSTLFDEKARDYARYRPGYPSELFEFIYSRVESFDLVWDAGTGSGQAAVELAKAFKLVAATDVSAAQLQFATPDERISYRVTPSENSGLEDDSCNLVTSANAVHWFDTNQFFGECQRVLRPKGVVAVWCYNMVYGVDAPTAASVRELQELVRPYWPEPIQLVTQCYRTLPFPFDEIVERTFLLRVNWTLEQFAGYAKTWSAAKAYRDSMGLDPVDEWSKSLCDRGSSEYTFEFPLHLKMGRRHQ